VVHGTANRKYIPLSEAVRDVALVPCVGDGGAGLGIGVEVSFGVKLLSIGAVDIWVEVGMPVCREYVRFPEMGGIGAVVPDIWDDERVFG